MVTLPAVDHAEIVQGHCEIAGHGHRHLQPFSGPVQAIPAKVLHAQVIEVHRYNPVILQDTHTDRDALPGPGKIIHQDLPPFLYTAATWLLMIISSRSRSFSWTARRARMNIDTDGSGQGDEQHGERDAVALLALERLDGRIGLSAGILEQKPGAIKQVVLQRLQPLGQVSPHRRLCGRIPPCPR